MKGHILIAILASVLVHVHSSVLLVEKVNDGSVVPIEIISDPNEDTMKTREEIPPNLSETEAMSAEPTESKINEPIMTENMASPAMTEEMSTNEESTGRSSYQMTAAQAFKNIFDECLHYGSFSCAKSKMLSYLNQAAKKDKILITDSLTIEKNGRRFNDVYEFEQPQQWDGSDAMRADVMMEKIDDFLASHELKFRVPKEIVSGELLPYVPKFLLQGIPAEMRVPLSESKTAGQERGVLKRVVMPFLLGLKFKATALIPLALAIIALKTWKALTLGLLSIVLSGALMIFKFTNKPKVVNYEVYHYPAATPVIEHPAPSYDHHGFPVVCHCITCNSPCPPSSRDFIIFVCELVVFVACVVTLVSMAVAVPLEDGKAFWRETPMERAVQDFKTKCTQSDDQVSCLKYEALTLLDHIFKKKSYKVSDAVEIVRNSFNPEKRTPVESGRSDDDEVLDEVEQYIKSHDMVVNLPGGATLNLSPRGLDDNEIDATFKFDQVEGKGRKSKLKKILIPVLVFILLKVTTLIPLFIGALGLKAWNALQLSFFAFVISVALAIFQLCKKLAADQSPPQLISHGGWDASASRNFDLSAHDLAYNAYATSS
ncbi:hypothetical protein L9F63_006343 [Diploptera punctata]|uniref:Osiris 18 n=1 Tax=Diploptera punctata TaxID=6984 RepID=A0AAD8E4L4_DIPPU|nr:hypothetical protein L9F63_006343 [Diploptera punctata]